MAIIRQLLVDHHLVIVEKTVVNDKHSDAGRELNQRDKQLIGRTTRLLEPVQKGNCRINLGDSSWSAISTHDTAGEEVVITAVDGIVLTISPTKE